VIRVREAWPIIENRDIEIELMSEWRNALRDVPRSRYPQWHGGNTVSSNNHPCSCPVLRPMLKSGRTPQRTGSSTAASFTHTFPRLGRARQNQSRHFAATDQSIIPPEIVIEDEIERRGLLGVQRASRPVLHLRFQASAAERAHDSSIREKQRFRSLLLRA
jgi:hypothetical protein